MKTRALYLAAVIILVLVVAAVALYFKEEGEPRTIYVPDDYSKIQRAVSKAAPGSTIIVRDGTYHEDVNVNKRLTIKSENGSANCIVHVLDWDAPVFRVTVNYVNITGFTATWGIKQEAAGIHLDGVEHCNIFSNNVTSNYFGIFLTDSDNNILMDNAASRNARCAICLVRSSNNIIYNNCFNDYRNAEGDGNTTWNITRTAGTNIIGGPYLGGNYWSDYAGNDTDGDGLGDTLLPHNGDYLPLVPLSGELADGELVQ